MTSTDEPPVAGMREIAEMIGTTYGSLQQMRFRHDRYRARALKSGGASDESWIPSPDWTISGNPMWDRTKIEAWARRTGRLTD